MRLMRLIRLRLTLCFAYGALALAQTGCGGGTATKSVTSAGGATIAAWSSQTEQLCQQKRDAIARLGYIHITYAGIAQAGLPAVKRALDRYFGKLLAVLQEFSARQRQIATPPSLTSTMAAATAVADQVTAATSSTKRELATVRSASALHTTFQSWIASVQRLADRADVVAPQLYELPDCKPLTVTQ